MSLRKLHRQIVIVTALAFSCLMPGLAAAQDDAFKEGMKAIDDKKWMEAATQMRKALQANPVDSRREVEYGGFIIRKTKAQYLPNFRLGEALFELQDCAGAVDAWANAEKQGAVNGSPELVRRMQNGFIVCETKGVLPPAKFEPLFQRVRQHYNEVNALAQTIATAGRGADEFQTLRDQYTNGTNELNAASNALSSAVRTRSQKDFDTASAAIDRAQATLQSVQAKFGGLVSETRAATLLRGEVEGTLGRADELERQVNSRLSDRRPALPEPIPSLRDSGREALAKAHDRFTAGSRPPNTAALNEASSAAGIASSKYQQVLEELVKLDASLLQEAVSGAEQALLLFDGLNGTLARRVAAKPTLADPEMTAERDAITKEVEGARRRLSNAKSSANGSSVNQKLTAINQARDVTLRSSARLNALLGRFGPLTLRERGVSEALEEGSRQFLAGQYDKALAALSAPEALAPDAPLQLHVHLFRAAALYAQLARAPKNDDLRRQALAEVAECKRLDSTFAPDPRAFSPAFIKFFTSGS